MGADIHMYTEIRGWFPNEEPRWIHVQQALLLDAPEQSHYAMNEPYDEEYALEDLPLDQVDGPEPINTLGRSWYPGRNYEEFQMLAGVRGETFPPMKPPTLELPVDTCQEIRTAYESWGVDAHTATYYTLDELVNIEKSGYFEQTETMITMIDKEKADHYIENEGATVIEGDELAEKLFPDRVRLQFEATYAEHAPYLTGELIPALKRLRLGLWNVFVEQLEQSDVRLIMWFDN